MEEILKQYEAREKQKSISIIEGGNLQQQQGGLQPGSGSSMYGVFQQQKQKVVQDSQFGSSILGQKRNILGNKIDGNHVGFDDYVTKSMNKCKTKSERQQMKKLLLQELQKMKNINMIDLKSYNFKNIELPILLREKSDLASKIQKKGQIVQNQNNINEDLDQQKEMAESLQLQISRVDAAKSALVYLKQQLFQNQNDEVKTLQIKNNNQGILNPFKKVQMEQEEQNLQQQQKLQQIQLQQKLSEQNGNGQNDDDGQEDDQVLGDLVNRIKKQKNPVLAVQKKTSLQEKIQQKTGFVDTMADRFKPLEQSLDEFKYEQDNSQIQCQIQAPRKANVQQKMEYKPYQYTQHSDHQTQKNITGVSNLLEKQYLRIQGQADPKEIRPLDILKKSFVFVIQKYKKNYDYCYIQQQLRAIRQDMLVQRIRNNFTVRVFEENARISLENQDKFEFIRTLHEIMTMYNEGLEGQYNEFTYYSLLLHIVQRDETHLQQLLSKLNSQQLQSKQIESALQYRSVIKMGNVHKFFKMYRMEKGYGKFILDFFIDRMRRWGVKMICKSYGPKEIPVNFFIEFLNFNGFDQCYSFFREIKAVIQRQNIQIKETLQNLNQYKEQQ